MYCICLIPFFSLFELLEIFENIENIVFVFASNTGNLLTGLFGIKIFDTAPVLFRGFNFTISVKFRLALSLNI